MIGLIMGEKFCLASKKGMPQCKDIPKVLIKILTRALSSQHRNVLGCEFRLVF